MNEKRRLFYALIIVFVILGIEGIVWEKSSSVDIIVLVSIWVATFTAFGTIYYAFISTKTFRELRNQGKKQLFYSIVVKMLQPIREELKRHIADVERRDINFEMQHHRRGEKICYKKIMDNIFYGDLEIYHESFKIYYPKLNKWLKEYDKMIFDLEDSIDNLATDAFKTEWIQKFREYNNLRTPDVSKISEEYGINWLVDSIIKGESTDLSPVHQEFWQKQNDEINNEEIQHKKENIITKMDEIRNFAIKIKNYIKDVIIRDVDKYGILPTREEKIIKL